MSAAASVIVTTYNRPDALRAVLAGLAAQSRSDFEVIVADDGSGEETREAVESMRPRFGERLQHAWQPDEGFRAAAVRNLGIARARSDYCIFLDGDCVPRRDFAAAHLAERGEKRLVRGTRLLLSESETHEALAGRAGGTPIHARGVAAWTMARGRGRVNRILPILWPWPLPWADAAGSRWRTVRTCNLACARHDLLEVGGFDESFVGWGYEDSDLVIRLLNAGCRIRRGSGALAVVHLWHREAPRTLAGENLQRLEEVKRSGRTRALRTSL